LALARQGRGDGTPVQPWGLSHSADSFQVRVAASNPLGRSRAKLQVQACPPGAAFTHTSCVDHTAANWTDITAATSGITLTETITGLNASTLYRWRARVLYDSPLNIHGPWRRFLGQALEADLRTAPMMMADLVIAKTVTPTMPVVPGASITYVLDFANSGTYTATGVVITDVVPISVATTSVISSGVAITDSGASPGYVWSVQNLAPGQGGVITITAVLSDPLAAGTFTNTARIAGAEAESDDANNRGDAGVTVSSCLATPDDGATLYPTVQGAVDAANSGDTVKVAGTCAWPPAPSGQQNLLTISQTLTIAGGYTQTNWLTAHPITQPTTLDAEYNGRVLYMEGGGITVTVNGLTLQRGSGGNVYASHARVLISDC